MSSQSKSLRFKVPLHVFAVLLAVTFSKSTYAAPEKSKQPPVLAQKTDPKPDPKPDQEGCDQPVELDKEGRPILPAGATDVEAPVSADEDRGLISNLYPNVDTTTDAFYPQLRCDPSIGGYPQREEPPSKDELQTEEVLSKFEQTNGQQIADRLLEAPLPPISQLDAFTVGDCFVITKATATAPGTRKQVPCNDAVFLNSAMPFEGRDIIYVHGLETADLMGRIHNPTGPESKKWPGDVSEFLSPNGYFRKSAEQYWAKHITEHLSSQDPSFSTTGWQWTATDPAPTYKRKSNRYLLVSWSSNQTIEYAQHALMTQIRLAMINGMNVVTPPTYRSEHVRPFCANGCIIIGHSTGPLITSSAMARAINGFYGAGGKQIPRHMLAHISFDGAISGSRVSTISYVVALGLAPLPAISNILCPIVDAIFGTSNTCNADLSFVANSILRDLIPAVSQLVWGKDIQNSPVPTITFAGGHPRGNQALGATQMFLPGMDDGVVTMNSACGNPNLVFPYITPPSGISVSSYLKALEFSDNPQRLARGVKIQRSQKNLMIGLPWPGALPSLNYLAAACTPYLSSSGMVLPVVSAWGGTDLDARKRYRNHYSFIQSLTEHSYDGGGSTPNSWPSFFAGLATDLREYAPWSHNAIAPVPGTNIEESRAVTDPSIYTRMIDSHGTRLVKPLDMHEVVRGKKVSFHFPLNLGNCKKKSVGKWYCTKWIWKRTYHLADKWEKKQSSHYAYEFVGRR